MATMPLVSFGFALCIRETCPSFYCEEIRSQSALFDNKHPSDLDTWKPRHGGIFVVIEVGDAQKV